MSTESLTKAINATPVLTAQAYIAAAPKEVKDMLQRDELAYTAKLAADAIKYIEEQRMSYTKPLDEAKKQYMEVEKQATAPLKQFVEQSRKLLLNFATEQQKRQDEANAKMQQEAAKLLKQETSSDNIGALIDQAATLHIEQPKNIRTTIKARHNNEFVNWSEVIDVLILADKFDPEWLLKGLPEAMKITGVEKIKGIELYEHKTQIIR